MTLLDSPNAEKIIATPVQQPGSPSDTTSTLGMNQKNGPHSIAAFQQDFYSGPVPPPEHLAKYEKIVPGIAKQFLEAPLLEAQHRRTCEKNLLEAQIQLAYKGQVISCILGLLCVIGSFTAIFLGHDVWGLGTLFGSIAAFIGVFWYGKSHKPSQS